VFAQFNGRPIERRSDWQAWKALLNEAGVREVRLHDGRHTAATLLLSDGMHPRVVMELLGHSQMRTTMDIYPGHARPRPGARRPDERPAPRQVRAGKPQQQLHPRRPSTQGAKKNLLKRVELRGLEPQTFDAVTRRLARRQVT
jgi:hypothetical protein